MSKSKHKVYICQQCGTCHSKWVGRCDSCNSWNAISEDGKQLKKREMHLYEKSNDIVLLELESHIQEVPYTSTGIQELDRMLGGGLVPGAALLIAGEPGIGKSTLLLQLSAALTKLNQDCIYVSGEESTAQLFSRANRLGLLPIKLKVASATNVTNILQLAQTLQVRGIMIIDSIQTLYDDNINSGPGTVSQVRYCTFELMKEAKKRDITLILVGHVTKDGQIAGPKILEHMVDTVAYFEGEHTQQFRIIRTTKNRYGPTNEIAVFEIQHNGLYEVPNPSLIFMPTNEVRVSGSCIFAGMEGSRALLVEVQALIAPSFLAAPRRTSVGWDTGRLAMMLAILNSRFGINLSDKEVYLNVVGGIKIVEPAADLAVAVALISAALNIIVPSNTAFFGEIGLSGELRQVSRYEIRLHEAAKLGLETIVLPYERKKAACNIERIWLKHISDLRKLFASEHYVKGSDKKH